MNIQTIPASPTDAPWRWQFAQHYEIEKLLAQGGQGTVYAARDCRTGHRVALKVIDSDDGEASPAHQRLMMEATIGNRLAGDNVVTIFDVGRDDTSGLSYLTMELLEGTDLQTHVEHHGAIPFASAVDYLRQVAEGLCLAHHMRDARDRLTPVVHRDLKPANLFLTLREDGTHLIKILDFGIAKVLEPAPAVTFNIRGSPLYMAPEQVSGASLSPATDIWALGLLTFFLLTGKVYWLHGQDRRCALTSLLREVSQGATVRPSLRLRQLNLDVQLPPAFDDWFLRCVHREPNLRFKTASCAVLALAQALDVAVPSLSGRAIRQYSHFAVPRRSLRPTLANPARHRRSIWLLLGAAAGFSAVLGIASSYSRLEPCSGVSFGRSGNVIASRANSSIYHMATPTLNQR